VSDSTGFDAFYAASSRRVLHALYAMTGDLGEAQDCVQEAYARAWQRWERVRGYDDPEAWVRTVAWRLAVNRWRRGRNALAALVRHGPPEPARPLSEDTVALTAALRRIPEAQRRAVVLHHLCGLSVEDVARETDAPVGTVKARLSRGRTALAALLCDDEAEPDKETSRA
jgi:RNA polymerase sigma-70 factor, ECF subfamily